MEGAHRASPVGGLAVLQPVVQGQGALAHRAAEVECVLPRFGGGSRLLPPLTPGDAMALGRADEHPRACQNSTRRNGPTASRAAIRRPRRWPLATQGGGVALASAAGGAGSVAAAFAKGGGKTQVSSIPGALRSGCGAQASRQADLQLQGDD